MPNKLTNIKIQEISGVTKGANRKKFLICKQEGGEPVAGEQVITKGDALQVAVEALGIAIMKTLEDPNVEINKAETEITESFDQFVEFIKGVTNGTFTENIAAKEIRSHMWEATDALSEAISAALNDTNLDQAGRITRIEADLAGFSEWILSHLTDSTNTAVTKAGAVMSSDRLKRLKETHAAIGAIITEAESGSKTDPPGSGNVKKGDDTIMKPEDITKAVEEALKPIATRLDALEKGEGAGTQTEGQDDVTKAVTEAITKAMEPIEKRLGVIEKAKGIKKSVDGQEGDGEGDEGDGQVTKSFWGGIL